MVTEHIRQAGQDELPALRVLERAAGEIFRDVGLAEIAEDDPVPVEQLEHFRRAGRAWVSTDARGRIVGYLLAEPVDEHLHIAQVSVHPDVAHRGVGRELIEHLAATPVAERLAGLTLTTYRHVPWNAPYYRRLGFTELPEHLWGTRLRVIRGMELEAGLDRWPRLAMVRPRLAPDGRRPPDIARPWPR